MKTVKYFAAFLLIFVFHGLALAGFEGSVSQTTIPEGESFQLYLRQDGDGETPDVSVLKQDFTIVGQRKSFKSSYINGKSEKFNETILTLIPKKTGQVILPSIQAGKEKTGSVTLTVVPAGTPVSAGSNQQGSNQPGQTVQSRIFLRANVSTAKPFVQEQVIYTVRLYASVPILDGVIIPPHADGVAIEQWGDPKRAQTVIDNQPYAVTEYRFVLFPQKSGKITIPPTRIQGVISDPDAQEQSMEDMFGGGFGFGGRTGFSAFFGQKNIVVQSGETFLDVQPKPAGAGDAAWLPATDVAVSEDITPPKMSVVMGDALTRTVSIMVSGVRDTQIPDPSFPDGNGYKQYPGKTDTKNLFDDKGIVGVKTRQVVFMPTQPGKLVLPALEVPWFDTKTKTMKKAVLPPRTVTVTPSQTEPFVPALAPAASIPAAASVPETAVNPARKTEGEMPAVVVEENLSPGVFGRFLVMTPEKLLGAGILIGASGILFLWLVFQLFHLAKVKKRHHEIYRESNIPRQKAVKAFKEACQMNDPAKAKEALMALGRIYWPENLPLSLSDLADKFADDAFFVGIENLNQALYAKENSGWSGVALWNIFKTTKQYKKTPQPEADDIPVPPLYPR